MVHSLVLEHQLCACGLGLPLRHQSSLLIPCNPPPTLVAQWLWPSFVCISGCPQVPIGHTPWVHPLGTPLGHSHLCGTPSGTPMGVTQGSLLHLPESPVPAEIILQPHPRGCTPWVHPLGTPLGHSPLGTHPWALPLWHKCNLLAPRPWCAHCSWVAPGFLQKTAAAQAFNSCCLVPGLDQQPAWCSCFAPVRLCLCFVLEHQLCACGLGLPVRHQYSLLSTCNHTPTLVAHWLWQSLCGILGCP